MIVSTHRPTSDDHFAVMTSNHPNSDQKKTQLIQNYLFIISPSDFEISIYDFQFSIYLTMMTGQLDGLHIFTTMMMMMMMIHMIPKISNL